MKRLLLMAETLVSVIFVVTLVILVIAFLRIIYRACQHGCLLGTL